MEKCGLRTRNELSRMVFTVRQNGYSTAEFIAILTFMGTMAGLLLPVLRMKP